MLYFHDSNSMSLWCLYNVFFVLISEKKKFNSDNLITLMGRVLDDRQCDFENKQIYALGGSDFRIITWN